MEDILRYTHQITSSPPVRDFTKRFKTYYKEGSIWTLETGCLIFTSWMIYYLIFISEDRGVLDIIVLIFFLLGALIYIASTSLFKKLSKTFSSQQWINYIQTANRYLFMVLSFLPGLYFAFKYEHFILRFYLIVYIGTSVYFLYKRWKDFELEPFAIGVAMSVGIYLIGPIIHTFFSIFGSGWFVQSVASMVESVVDLALAVAFFLQIPQKKLPTNMLFGLRIIKFFMYILSWQTWFALMVFSTWCNLGAGLQAGMETWNGIEVKGGSKKLLQPGTSSAGLRKND